MQTEKMSVTTLYDNFIAHTKGAPKAATFRTWVGMGTKFAAIAGAGEL